MSGHSRGSCTQPMGVWDRDYVKRETQGEGRPGWRSYVPPGATLALLGLHVLGFLFVLMMRHDVGPHATVVFVLHGSAAHPAAILLHPIGATSVLTIAFIVFATWSLGSCIEHRFGAGPLLALYVLGNLFAGTVYFGFAQMAPAELTEFPLAVPIGALAAWTLAAWRSLRSETVTIFGRVATVSKASAAGAAVVCGLVFCVQGQAATGWLLAAAAGSLAWVLLSAIGGGVGAASGSRRRQRAESAWGASPRRSASSGTDENGVDDILAKVGREGLDALTPAERDRLEAARQAKLQKPR